MNVKTNSRNDRETPSLSDAGLDRSKAGSNEVQVPLFRVGDRPWIDDALSRCSKRAMRVLIVGVVEQGSITRYWVVPFHSRDHEPILIDEKTLSSSPVAKKLSSHTSAHWVSSSPVRPGDS